MFIGLSMKMDYFREKVNLFVALAPVVNNNHTTSPLLKILSETADDFELLAVDILGMYNMFPPDYYES